MSVQPTKISTQKLEWLMNQPVDVKIQMLGHHMELCRLLVNELLEEQLAGYTGRRYERQRPHNGRYQRWGHNPGSVKLGSGKVPIMVPRVGDQQRGRCTSL